MTRHTTDERDPANRPPVPSPGVRIFLEIPLARRPRFPDSGFPVKVSPGDADNAWEKIPPMSFASATCNDSTRR